MINRLPKLKGHGVKKGKFRIKDSFLHTFLTNKKVEISPILIVIEYIMIEKILLNQMLFQLN